MTEIEGEIPSITCLATNSALTAVENKIPDVSGFVKKNDYNTKISDIEKKTTDHNHDKYITTPEFNSFSSRGFYCKTSTSKFSDKNRFYTRLKDISDQITSNKSKHLLAEIELKKITKI